MVALTSSLGKAFAGNTVSRETKGRISGIYLCLFSLHTHPGVLGGPYAVMIKYHTVKVEREIECQIIVPLLGTVAVIQKPHTQEILHTRE